MLRLRRTDHELRVEMTPLMDVIFLLLTFFIYAMVLMVRVHLLPVQMEQHAAGEAAGTAPVITVGMDQQGRVLVEGEHVPVDHVVQRLQQAQAERPGATIYVAADERGEVDRLPAFLRLYNELAAAGLDIKLVFRPAESDSDAADQSETLPAAE